MGDGMIWWLPIAFALLIAIALVWLYRLSRTRNQDPAIKFRAEFEQLVRRLEKLTVRVNVLARALSLDQDRTYWDSFEEIVNQYEKLLGSMQAMPTISRSLDLIRASDALVGDMEQRLDAYTASLRKPQGALDAAKAAIKIPPVFLTKGCYFCSRPFVLSEFRLVKVRIDGNVVRAVGCSVCRNALKDKKKVKVLYFRKEGQQMHWSETTGYQPKPDYYDINEDEKSHRTQRNLSLVYSRVDAEAIDTD